MSSAQSLFPFDAMWREIGCAYRALEYVRQGTKEAVAGLAEADLDLAVAPGAPSIGRLYAHVGSSEAWLIHKLWRRESPPASWKPLFAYGNLAKPFPEGPRPTIAELGSLLDEIREATRLALMKTNDHELDRASITTPDGPATLRWVLFHVLEHEAHHRGQITLTLRAAGKIPAPSR
jgi:uncharacterized damage-inducible protein DinB